MDDRRNTRTRNSVAVGLAPATGEDGDIKQLSIVREQRRLSQTSECEYEVPTTSTLYDANETDALPEDDPCNVGLSSDETSRKRRLAAVDEENTAQRRISQGAERVIEETATTSEVTFADAYDIYALPKEDPFIAGGPSCDFGKQRLEAMRKRLFAAVDEEDRAQVVVIVNDINDIGNVADVRDAKTGQNVLHYATLNEKWNIVKLLVAHCSQDILMSQIQGEKTALHIITEKNNVKMAELILDKLYSTLKLKLIKLAAPMDIEDKGSRMFSCLHLAAYYGYTDIVRLYLDNGMNVNHQTDRKKDTALMWASRWGHNDTVKLLLDRGADIETKNDQGYTALPWAITYNHPKTVALLLQHGKANPNTQSSVGLVSPIIIASAYGLADVVYLLLQHQTDVNISIPGGGRAIHHAAREGYFGVLEQLVNKGASIDCQDDLGYTPLLLAAKNGHVDVVQFLIKEGANLKQRNNEDQDAWKYAIECEENDLLRTLVESSRDMDLGWRQPLCIAAYLGKADKVEFLLNMEQNIERSSDPIGNTFLHCAAVANRHTIIDKFHTKLYINVQNKRKETPLHVACSKGHCETIISILRCKAKTDIQNENGETALHVAAFSKDITPESVRALVDYTSKTHAWESLNAKDFHENNCLHIAGKKARPEVMWEFRHVRVKDRDQDGLTPLHEAVRPGEPEALETMLNIFETMSRDANINEQSKETLETVLHLAADECHVKSVKRLIQKFGADISIQDRNGDTVLHRLTRASVADSRRVGRHLEVLDVILDNIVRWWCIKENKPFPEEENQDEYRAYRREATLYVVNRVPNKKGLTVLDQAFQVGAAEILYHLLMMPDITMFEAKDIDDKDITIFDITGLTPRTSNLLTCCYGSNSISPLNDVEHANKSREMPTDPRLSGTGMEWLVSQRDKMQAAKLLDIPPISMLEKYYTSVVSRTFRLLIVFHIIYMSMFTYLGVDLLGKLREDATQINDSDPQTILLYVLVPMEPILIVVFGVYILIRHIVTRDVCKKFRLSKKQGLGWVTGVIAGYMFRIVCVLFAVLVFTWIVMFTTRYEYQDYVLAAAICIGWLLTVALTRGMKEIHYFYKMLISMIGRDVRRFIAVYFLVLMAFGSAFHILFQVSRDIATDLDVGETLLLTFNMMVGMDELITDELETNMEAVGRNTTYLKIFSLLYIILSTVILLNLLIAMMNDSYQMILRNNQVTWRIESVALGIEIESNFPATKFLTSDKLLRGNEVSPIPERQYRKCPWHCGGACHNESGVPTKPDTEFATKSNVRKVEGISDDRWYVTTSSSEFKKYLQNLEKQSGSQDAVSKRLDELEQRQVEMEKQSGSQDAASKRLDELEQRQVEMEKQSGSQDAASKRLAVEMEKQTLQKLDHQTTLMDTMLSKIDKIHK